MGAASHLARVPPNYLFTQLLQSIFKGMHNDSCDGNGYMNIDMLIFLAKINALFCLPNRTKINDSLNIYTKRIFAMWSEEDVIERTAPGAATLAIVQRWNPKNPLIQGPWVHSQGFSQRRRAEQNHLMIATGRKVKGLLGSLKNPMHLRSYSCQT